VPLALPRQLCNQPSTTTSTRRVQVHVHVHDYDAVDHHHDYVDDVVVFLVVVLLLVDVNVNLVAKAWTSSSSHYSSRALPRTLASTRHHLPQGALIGK
jgi:hypothetical protein